MGTDVRWAGAAWAGTWAGTWAGSWAGVLVPVRCPGCGADDVAVCRACRAAVLHGPLRPRPLADGTLAVASAPWRGPARGLVSAAKEAGRRDVQEVLARAVARAVVHVGWGEEPPAGRLLLVSPPSRPGAVWRRRDRPGEVLAASTARLLRAAGADVRAAGLLRHTRAVRDQAGLGRSARAENLAGAFGLVPWAGRALAGADVVVVDDVLTTGATVLEVAAALRHGGARVRGAALVAAA